MKNTLTELKNGNRIAAALTILAWAIFIGGFIAGFALGKVEVMDPWPVDKFSFAKALIYWFSALISGIMMLGFSEIIKLLEDIKNK